MQGALFAWKLSFCRALFAFIVVLLTTFFCRFFFFFFSDRWDYLRITDDRNNTIGAFCGYQTGKRVLVVASVALLTFHSDSSIQYRGFELTFSFFPRGEFRILFTVWNCIYVIYQPGGPYGEILVLKTEGIVIPNADRSSITVFFFLTKRIQANNLGL